MSITFEGRERWCEITLNETQISNKFLVPQHHQRVCLHVGPVHRDHHPNDIKPSVQISKNCKTYKYLYKIISSSYMMAIMMHLMTTFKEFKIIKI